jgi:hypothetical protein
MFIDLFRKPKGVAMNRTSSPPPEYIGNRQRRVPLAPTLPTTEPAPNLPTRPLVNRMSEVYAQGIQHVHDLENRCAELEAGRAKDQARIEFLELRLKESENQTDNIVAKAKIEIEALRGERDKHAFDLGVMQGELNSVAASLMATLKKYVKRSQPDDDAAIASTVGESAVAEELLPQTESR